MRCLMIQQNMLSLFTVVLILAAVINLIGGNQPGFMLSPPLPQTAFVGLFYTCQLRVIGLDFPVFGFKGLPKEFNSSSNGTITGIPKNIGSYLITVSLSSSKMIQQLQTILRIVEPLPQYSTIRMVQSEYKQIVISANRSSYVFTVGYLVSINFTADYGVPPYLWMFNRLPAQLKGTTNGYIQGYFQRDGYYSFGVICSDSIGQSSDAYITLNLQPLIFFKLTQQKNTLKDIFVRNPTVEYNLIQVLKTQSYATTNLSEAFKILQQAKTTIFTMRSNYAKSNYAIMLSNLYISQTELQLSRMAVARQIAQANQKQCAVILFNSNVTVKQEENVLNYSHENTLNKLVQLKNSNASLINETIKLRLANDLLSQAQNNVSSVLSEIDLLTIQYNDSANQVNLTLNAQFMAQQESQAAQARLVAATTSVQSAKSRVKLALLDNDQAVNQFNQTLMMADISQEALKNAKNLILSIKPQIQKAKNALALSQLTLLLAMNKLLVAQAAKAQADILLSILSAYENNSINKAQFDGCNQKNYPTFIGSGMIVDASQNYLLMDSGQQLLSGTCTEGGSITNGDFLQFQGYFANGFGHLIRYSKISPS